MAFVAWHIFSPHITITITYHLQSLFTQDAIQHYYPILEAIFMLDTVVIHVCFKSAVSFLG